MAYELFYTKGALKDLSKLEKQIQERVLAVLERCRIRPHAFVKKLVGGPYFKLRAGDYRVIADIKQNQLVIFVIEIGHRKNIYER